ncbi:MAG: CDP-alcohol phosphatidyltransferase family protein [Thermoleophilia bacterium]
MLTMFRLLLIPVFIYFLAGTESDGSLIAGILFAVASFTDWLDGQIARRTDTITDFGRFADPLADRLLIGSALVILLVRDRLPALALMTVLVRDTYIMAGYYVLNRRGVRVPVILLGKIGTAVLMLALLLAILGVSVAVPLFWIGVAVSVVSAGVYTSKGLRQFRRPQPGVVRQAGT